MFVAITLCDWYFNIGRGEKPDSEGSGALDGPISGHRPKSDRERREASRSRLSPVTASTIKPFGGLENLETTN